MIKGASNLNAISKALYSTDTGISDFKTFECPGADSIMKCRAHCLTHDSTNQYLFLGGVNTDAASNTRLALHMFNSAILQWSAFYDQGSVGTDFHYFKRLSFGGTTHLWAVTESSHVAQQHLYRITFNALFPPTVYEVYELPTETELIQILGLHAISADEVYCLYKLATSQTLKVFTLKVSTLTTSVG